MSSSVLLQASSGPEMIDWYSINWPKCNQRVKSLQRRIVQAVQAGAWRKVKRRNGKAGKLQITPSKASFQAIKTKVKALCKRHKGATPEELINKLNPVLRGWANYHRYVICAETFSKVDSFVWGESIDGANAVILTEPDAGSQSIIF